MVSVFEEIKKLRSGRPISVDNNNSNRYRVVSKELDGSKTSYFFSVPIYNQKTRKLVNLKFQNEGEFSCCNGSNTDITIDKDILFESSFGSCSITLPETITSKSETKLICGKSEIMPTVNGLAIKAFCPWGFEQKIKLLVDKPFMNIRANDKYFSVMREQFKPFITVSCIGTLDEGGELISPCVIQHKKPSDKEYALSIKPISPLGKNVLYEVNIHQPKLFEDTTVESGTPGMNNAFGGTAYIGNTLQFGEQWLYSRPDFAKLSELTDKRINKAVLYLPKCNHSNVELSAFKLSARFCSFGSNWDNKITAASELIDSVAIDGYHCLNIYELLTEKNSHHLMKSEGLIIKNKVKGSGYTAVSTGDSSYAPQILEINYK